MSILDAPKNIAGGVIDPIASAIAHPFKKTIKDYKPQDFPGGFNFIEIIDGIEQTHEKVSLTGNMLPMIPFQFGGSQRITKDYYPGNSEPAVQVLGPKESDVTIHGKFKDKRFKDIDVPQGTGIAREFQKQIDAIRIRGNLLRIHMGDWQRYGFLEETDFKMNRLSEIEYQLKFSIVGFNKPINAKFAQKTKETPVNKELLAAASAFNQNTPPITVPLSIADVLNGYINSVAGAMALVTNFVGTVVNTVEDVQKSANRAIGLIKHARTTLAVFNRRVGDIATGFNSLSSDAKAATNFSHVFQNQQYILGLLTSSSALAALLNSLQSQFDAISKLTPLARYKVKDGDTLQKLAIKYYNNPDNWSKIYDHNKLTSTALVRGALLEIPRV